MIADIFSIFSKFILLHLVTLLSEGRDFYFFLSAGFRTLCHHEFIFMPDVGESRGAVLCFGRKTQKNSPGVKRLTFLWGRD